MSFKQELGVYWQSCFTSPFFTPEEEPALAVVKVKCDRARGRCLTLNVA